MPKKLQRDLIRARSRWANSCAFLQGGKSQEQHASRVSRKKIATPVHDLLNVSEVDQFTRSQEQSRRRVHGEGQANSLELRTNLGVVELLDDDDNGCSERTKLYAYEHVLAALSALTEFERKVSASQKGFHWAWLGCTERIRINSTRQLCCCTCSDDPSRSGWHFSRLTLSPRPCTSAKSIEQVA